MSPETKTAIWAAVAGGVVTAVLGGAAQYALSPIVSLAESERRTADAAKIASLEATLASCSNVSAKLATCETDLEANRLSLGVCEVDKATFLEQISARDVRISDAQSAARTASRDIVRLRADLKECTSKDQYRIDALRLLDTAFENIAACFPGVDSFGSYADAISEIGQDQIDLQLSCAQRSLSNFTTAQAVLQQVERSFNGQINQVAEAEGIAPETLFSDLVAIYRQREARRANIEAAIERLNFQ